MTSSPEELPDGTVPTRTASTRDAAAGSPRARAAVNAPGARPNPRQGGTRGTQDRASGTDLPSVPLARKTAAGAPPLAAGSGQVESSSRTPARTALDATPSGVQGSSSRGVARGGTADPGTSPPGSASASLPAVQGPGGRETSPEGGACDRAAASPSGTTGLSGQEARDAWRKAASKRAAEKRAGRGRYPVRRAGDGYRPGTARRIPGGGAA